MFVQRFVIPRLLSLRTKPKPKLNLRFCELRYRLFSSSPNAANIRILYGSQTGTAQLFAHQLAEGFEDEGLENISVQGLDEAPVNELLTSGHLHLLLASCAGKGEPPDNAREFYDWIMNDPSAKLPVDIKYAVFGLGNQAAHPNNYNVIGKRIDAKLEEMGGIRMKELGLGNDGECIEDDFDRWMEVVISSITKWLTESTPQSETQQLDAPETDEDKVDEEAIQPTQSEISVTIPEKTKLISNKYPSLVLDPAQGNIVRRDLFHLQGLTQQFYAENTCKLKVIDNHLLTSDAGESALHEIRVSLDRDYATDHEGSSTTDLSYETGDHLLVYPRNSEAIVKAYIDMLDVDPHSIVSDKNDDAYPYHTGITLYETLSHCIDLGALPSPGFCRKILRRKELDYLNEIAIPRRTVIDLCHEAETQLSVEDFIYNSVPMKPRYYSIASSSMKHPNEIHLVYRPVHYMTSKGYLREGVCTSFMMHKGSLQKGDHDIACLPSLINPNPSFRLPKDPTVPVLLIGGGCGVAPIKAFIEERIMIATKQKGTMGPATLFMGFRTPQDEVYQDLVQKALEVGALSESEIVYDAGCDNTSGHCMMLVSDLVGLKGEQVWNHIHKDGGHVYMCGGARTFGAALEAALIEIFQEQGGMDFDGAMSYIRNLVEEGRLAEDIAN